MHTITLSEINIYPIKSLGGISLQEARVEERGLQYDRRWMLVGRQNQCLTQRKYPQMALCKTALEPEGIRVSFPGMNDLLIPFAPQTAEKVQVTVWGDTCEAVVVHEKANTWFSKVLALDCKLVFMPDDTRRAVDKKYDPGENAVSFADGFPFLLISEASLADLNERLEEPVLMNRFRPSLVVKNTEAFAEDKWKKLQIGAVLFQGVKLCGRCVMTTIDQTTAEKGAEPLKTLAGYRTAGKKVLFGQSLVYGQQGSIIRVGDEVQVVSNL